MRPLGGPKYGASPLYAHHTTSLVFNDPPLHTRVRKLIAGAPTRGGRARFRGGPRFRAKRDKWNKWAQREHALNRRETLSIHMPGTR
jgi:cytochrome P450